MEIRLIGDRRDVIGFGLAGIDGVECRTRQELISALDAAARDPAIALVIVSPSAAALGADVLARHRESARPPIAVVLPDLAEAERAHSS